MRIGLALPQFGPLADAARIAPFAATAEELGFDTVGVGDRLLTPLTPSDPYPGRQQPYPAEFTTGLDPIVTLSVAAAATGRIGLTTNTLNVPQFNPVLLGRALTSLDVLSNGRLSVGVGLGWMRDEYVAAGVDWSTRGARLDETLELWRALWTTNPVRHEGRFHRMAEAEVGLRPVRPGGPELLFAGLRPAAMRRVGRYGAGWLMVQGLPEAYARELWDAARRAADDAGRDPGLLRRVLRVNVPAGADPIAHVAAAAVPPVDEVLIDLTFCTRGVDEALDVAARLRGTAAEAAGGA